jgi:hypothetical protein
MKYPIIDQNSVTDFNVNSYFNVSEFVDLPFIIESHLWEKVDNFLDADIIPMKVDCNRNDWKIPIDFLKKIGVKNNQLLVVMLIHDDCDTYDFAGLFDEYQEFLRQHSDYQAVLLHNNSARYEGAMNSNKMLYYDHIFNRQKAYFTEFEKLKLYHKLWTYWTDGSGFKLNPIEKTGNLSDRKIFLTPNRVYPFSTPRVQYRRLLRLLLENKNGYMSDPTNNIYLDTEEERMMDIFKNDNHGGGGSWVPISNKYYETSYISIYVETITSTFPNFADSNFNFESITEKSYDPLIKGHFILPFSYKGIVRDLKKMGFLFPDWIDYSYDDINMDIERFAAFSEELKRLVNMPVEQIHNLYEKTKHILEHNRSIFYNRPYSLFHDPLLKLKKSII